MSSTHLSFMEDDEWDRLKMGRFSDADERLMKKFMSGSGAAFWKKLVGIGAPPSRLPPGSRTRFADARGRTGFYLAMQGVRYSGTVSGNLGKHTLLTHRGAASEYQGYIEREGAVETVDGRAYSLGNIALRAEERIRFWQAADAFADEPHRRSSTSIRQHRLVGELPYESEIGPHGRLAIVIAVGEWLERKGMAWHAAIHLPPADGDPRNHHVHFAYLDRPAERIGFGAWRFGDKHLDPQKVTFRVALRNVYADAVNAEYARAGLARRYDPSRQLDRLGWEASIFRHMGPAVSAKEKRGIATVKGEEIGRSESFDVARSIRLRVRKESREVATALARTAARINRAGLIDLPGGDDDPNLYPRFETIQRQFQLEERRFRSQIFHLEARAELEWATYRERRLRLRAERVAKTSRDPEAVTAARAWSEHVRHEMSRLRHDLILRRDADRERAEIAATKAAEGMKNVEAWLAMALLARALAARQRLRERLLDYATPDGRMRRRNALWQALVEVDRKAQSVRRELTKTIGPENVRLLRTPDTRDAVLEGLSIRDRDVALDYVNAVERVRGAEAARQRWKAIESDPARCRKLAAIAAGTPAAMRSLARADRLVQGRQRAAGVPVERKAQAVRRSEIERR